VIEAVLRVVAVWPAVKGANSPKMRIIQANRSAILTKLAVVAVVAVVATCTKWGEWLDAQSHTLKSCRLRLRDKLVQTRQGSGCKPLQNSCSDCPRPIPAGMGLCGCTDKSPQEIEMNCLNRHARGGSACSWHLFVVPDSLGENIRWLSSVAFFGPTASLRCLRVAV
jgi:hypothetical protein